MLHKVKIPLIIVVVSSISLWVGSSFFSYFTHADPPEVVLRGIEKDGCYAGMINCAIKSDNGYKISEISVFLDNKELELRSSKKVGARKFEIPFRLDTLNLANGEHSIDIESADASYHRNKSKEKWNFYVDNIPLKAAVLYPEYKVDQGRTVHVRVQSNKRLDKAQIKFLENLYDCYPESDFSNVYECFIPIDCELAANEYMMTADIQDCVQNSVKLASKITVNSVTFPKQRGFTVAKEKLEEEKEVSMNNRILEEALEKWIKDYPKKKLWAGNFENPIEIKRVATPYGEIRTTTEKGRYLHRAVDIINHPKSVVWTSQNGKVIIKDRFLMTGNTVAVDHGLGVVTLYCHLEDFADIEVGDYIKKGNPIGRLGMTGYANGYHLHWELRVNNVAVDPFEWTKKTF